LFDLVFTNRPVNEKATTMITPFERIKTLINNIQKLEDKLMNTGFIPLAEQNKIHEEIRKFKEEIKLLERRTK